MTFENDGTFVGSLIFDKVKENFEDITGYVIEENFATITGNWSQHSVAFQSGNFSGNGSLISNSEIHGVLLFKKFQGNFQISKNSLSVTLL